MHDIELHIGDLIVSWARYGPDERGMLLNLMLHYYKEEEGLPDDAAMLEEIADCRTAAHRKTLAVLVRRHYKPDAAGVLRHKRADIKIAEYRHRCHVNAHNSLSRFVKESGGKFGMVSLEVFAADRNHFQDPITKRWRNLPDGKAFVGKDSPPAKDGDAEIRDSQNTAMRKVAPSGASLPPSHSPTLPPNLPTNNSSTADVEPASVESGSVAEKKERGDGIWWDVGSAEARRSINVALGREPGRAFTAAEMHALAEFSEQTGGVSEDDMTALRRFLLASPRYDSRVESDMAAVPEGSLLRKRKRFAGNVITDLPNQIDFARAWAATPERPKKEKGGEPPWRWREFAAAQLSFEPAQPWSLLLDWMRAEILAAWGSSTAEERASFV